MLFSVIVPVYNAEKYLRQCVKSIVNQTFIDFELILVDDGSTDGSGEICDEMAEKSEKICAIHQVNRGQTEARKAGLQEARGAYILYVDADDWIASDMLQKAADIIGKWNPALLTCGYLYEGKGNSETVVDPVAEGLYDKEALAEEIYPRLLCSDKKECMLPSVGKIASAGLLRESQENVDARVRQGEDAALSLWLYAGADRVWISHEVKYHYRVMEPSTSYGFRISIFDDMAITFRYFEGISPEGVADYKEQVNRYVLMLMLCIMEMAVAERSWGKMRQVKRYLKRADFRDHIRRAKFSKISLKTRIAFFLIRKSRVRLTYLFLKVCSLLKGRK